MTLTLRSGDTLIRDSQLGDSTTGFLGTYEGPTLVLTGVLGLIPELVVHF